MHEDLFINEPHISEEETFLYIFFSEAKECFFSGDGGDPHPPILSSYHYFSYYNIPMRIIQITIYQVTNTTISGKL